MYVFGMYNGTHFLFQRKNQNVGRKFDSIKINPILDPWIFSEVEC